MSFGTRLRQVRQERHLTIEKLAELVKSSENVIRGYEKSRRMPTSEMMLRICEALQVAPDYLYQDELSFNPYEDTNITISKLEKLPSDKKNIVKYLINFLTEQEKEQEQNRHK